MKKYIYITALLSTLCGITSAHTHDFQVIKKHGLVELDCSAKVKSPYENAKTSCLFDDANTAIIYQENKKGLINQEGVLLTPIEYDDILLHHEVSIVQIGDKYGLIHTKTGKQITPVHFEDVGFLKENLINVKINGNWGYVDTTGKTVIAFKYGNAYHFENGLAIVSNHGYVKDDTYRLGLIDKQGREIFPTIYRGITVLEDKIYLADESGLQGVSNLQGDPLFKPKYPVLGAFSHGYAPFALFYHDFYGYLNEQGEEAIAPQYLKAKYPHKIGGKLLFMVAKETDKGVYWGAVDEHNHTVIDFIYKELQGQFDENLIIATNQDYDYIVIDHQGTPLTTKTYDSLSDFYHGVSQYLQKDKYGLLSRTGDEITPAIYNSISREYNHDNTTYYGMLVNQEDKFGFLNPQGQEVLPAVYDEVVVHAPLIYVKKDGLYGVADLIGNIITPPIYEEIYKLRDGYSKVKDQHQWYLLDSQGKILGKTSAP